MIKKVEYFLVEILSCFVKYLNIYIEYIKNKYENIQSKYQFLTPNDEAEHIEEYSNALTDALKNEKVRNIAISGSYGSGKSSFIKTFEKNSKNNSIYEFLDISLARFNKKDEADNNIDLSLIEKSILEQMFYKVKSKKIPQSRLNKINRLRYLPFKVSSSLLVVLSFFIVFKPKALLEVIFFKDIVELFRLEYIRYIPIIILIIGAYFFTRKLLFILSNTSIDKINLKDLEIVSNDKNNESLLNKHLDEILYFFEKTTFNVIVFQDLDRFENLDIFTKLRELNNFINNSEQIDRDVKFLYAVKDEIFHDSHERTKFFDFVIPIIPYINATNSKDKLLELFGNDIKHNFLYDISLFISDMRLLKNIYNEYKVYSLNLDAKLNKTELLAMIIYKNFEPQDFEKLHKYEGIVYDIFYKKSEYIKSIIEKLKKQIDEFKGKIKIANDELLESIEELQQIYLFKIIENLNNQYNGTLYIDGDKSFNIKNINSETFELISKSSNIKSQYVQGYNTRYSQNVDFKEIEENIGSYQDRKEAILSKNESKKNELLIKIKKLEEEINEIENYRIMKIIDKYKEINIFDDKFNNHNLMKYLISYGHINEDYRIYMSNFFGISISKNDHDFLINIKNDGNYFDFNYDLDNLEEILKKESLEIWEFKKESILNYKLINHIINNQPKYPRQYIQIFKQLSNENESSKNFIFGYIDTQKTIDKFLERIVRYYPSIWEYLVTSDNFTLEEQEKYFYKLIDNLKLEDILRLNVEDSLKDYIKSKTEFYHIPHEAFNKKLEQVIKSLDIKFKLFKEHRERITPFKFVYENNYYELNEEMINYIVYVQNDFNSTVYEELNKAHYTTLQNTNSKYLKEYISENINEYIENVFLEIDTNVEETENTIINLLNDEKIAKELKVKTIQKQKNKISDINLIKNQELWRILLNENKIISSWENLIYYYMNNDNKIDESLISYLNIEENYKILSKTKINNEKDFDKNTILSSFNKELMLCNDINDEAYSYLIRSVWFWKYTNLDIGDIKSKKVGFMLEHTKFGFNSTNFRNLKENFSLHHITFIENNINDFIEKFEEFNIDEDDIIKLLESKNITLKNKKNIIELIDYNLINNSKMAQLIYANVDKSKIKSYVYIKNMVSNLANIESKINLIVEQESELNNEEFINILELLPIEYSKIAKLNGKQTLLDETKYNKDLILILHRRKFVTSDKTDKKNKIRLFIKSKL